MPIHVERIVESLPEEEFKKVAYAVTGAAFKLHNEYGSLFSENHYKHALAEECVRTGLRNVDVEVPIVVSHGDFCQRYSVDLVVDGGALFELKAIRALANEHRAQTLNYLYLMGLQRAKLINFGPACVEHEFVSTTLSPTDRRRFTVHRDRWIRTNEKSARFMRIFLALLHDWGCFLSLSLYTEAITDLLRVDGPVIQEVPITRSGTLVGKQKIHLLDRETAFKITAVGDGVETVEEHIRRFFSHATIRTVQWVNLYHHDATFTTMHFGNG